MALEYVVDSSDLVSSPPLKNSRDNVGSETNSNRPHVEQIREERIRPMHDFSIIRNTLGKKALKKLISKFGLDPKHCVVTSRDCQVNDPPPGYTGFYA